METKSFVGLRTVLVWTENRIRPISVATAAPVAVKCVFTALYGNEGQTDRAVKDRLTDRQ